MAKNRQGKQLNQLLRQARERRGWSQGRLAQELKVSPKTISRWERGTSWPYPHYRGQLCLLFGKSAAALGLLQEQADEGPEEGSDRFPSEASPIPSVLARTPSSDQAASSVPLWHVPSRRNAFFTGREEVLETLHTQLGVDRAVALTHSSALHGLGGVGKTQIALEYAYRHTQDYRALFWIGAETEEQIVASFLRIASVLQLPEQDEQDQERVVTAVQRWLTTHDRWLLIWDNMEDLELLDHFLPSTGSGAVLITTRCRVLGTLARGIDLVPMEREEGMLFLLRRAKILSLEATREQLHWFAEQMPAQYSAAVELVNALGGLPLALDQVGAYLEKTYCGVPAYLDLFRKRQAVLLKLRGEGAHDHPDSVSTTFTLALSTTAEGHLAVLDLLRVCAFLQPDAIPEELFQQGAKHLGATLEAVCRDPLEWDEMVGVACASSLLSRHSEEQMLSLHRLVQAVLLDGMSEEEREQWSRRVIEALAAVFPQATYQTWGQCERLLPHVLAMAMAIPDRAGNQEFAQVLQKAANYLRDRAQYEQAEALYQRAVRLLEVEQGPEDRRELASALNDLAVLYFVRGHYERAKPFHERALHILEQVLGPEHPEVARPLSHLALLYKAQGKYEQAELMYRRLRPIQEQAYGPEHPELARSAFNLALLYSEQEKDEQAEPLYQQALRIVEQAHGPEHLNVAYPLHGLADLCLRQRQYDRAEPLYQRTLQIREQALGPEHPLVAHALHGLATLYLEQNRSPEAEALLQRTLAIREQHLGPEHPDTAHTLHDLAILRKTQGDLVEARSLAERALSIRARALGEGHSYTVATQALYAQLLRHQEKQDQQQPGLLTMNVVVRGAAEQGAYTRTVKKREITFTCMMCGQTVTQLRYPSGQIKYCSDACRAIRAAQRQQIRVANQREKRRSTREARLRVQPREHV